MVQVLIEPAGTPLLLALANTYYDEKALASSTILRALKHYSMLTHFTLLPREEKRNTCI